MARLLVIHPTLGTGGGSRWSLQAAEALATRGHEVGWIAGTAQRAPEWQELKSDAFRREFVPVQCPETIGGRARAWCSEQRTAEVLRAARRLHSDADAVLLDNVPFVLPLARKLFPRARLVFYCHFPEALYARAPRAWLRWHRDYWVRRERGGLGVADQILTNSAGTRRRLLTLFPELDARVVVCHPAVRAVPISVPVQPRHVLCVARFDPTKNLSLALEAYARYRSKDGASALPLIFAGGFDRRWRAARETRDQLVVLQATLDVPPDACVMRPEITDGELSDLYRGALALVHPTPDEHFGLVALEAMARGVPVIGLRTSGLAESVEDAVSGYLVSAEPETIAARLLQLHTDVTLRERMSVAARQRVAAGFLLEQLGERLERALLLS